tara:strand:- start:176 stop:418 length:243 start_codon:yes stop_codon:yes gene_type:complete
MQPIQVVQVLLSVATKTARVLPVHMVRIKMNPVKLNVKIVWLVLLVNIKLGVVQAQQIEFVPQTVVGVRASATVHLVKIA